MRILLTFLLLVGIADAQATGSDLLKKAEAGDVAAQLTLARSYEMGNGRQRDMRQAGHWYARAAKQGNGEAMYALGILLYNGETLALGISENLELAWAWFSLAADAGVPQAADARDRTATELTPIRLETAHWTAAALLLEGERLPRSKPAALKYLEWMHEHGSVRGSLLLADMYLSGNGVPQDYARAESTCIDVAKQSAAGNYCLGRIYDLTGKPQQAFEAYLKAAEKGRIVEAILPLAACYAEGRGTPADPVKALSWAITAERLRLSDAAQKRAQLEQLVTEKQRKKAAEQADERGLGVPPAALSKSGRH